LEAQGGPTMNSDNKRKHARIEATGLISHELMKEAGRFVEQ
jgi:hypothetical protein